MTAERVSSYDDGRYIDWTGRTDDGRICLEVGDENGDAVVVDLNDAQFAAMAAQMGADVKADSVSPRDAEAQSRPATAGEPRPENVYDI